MPMPSQPPTSMRPRVIRRAALTQAVADAVVAIEELRSRLEQAEQVVSYGFTRGEFVTRPRL